MTLCLLVILAWTAAVCRPSGAGITLYFCSTNVGVRLWYHYKEFWAANGQQCYTKCVRDSQCWLALFKHTGWCYLYKNGHFGVTRENGWTAYVQCIGSSQCYPDDCTHHWSQWTTCTKPCAGGRQTCTRTKRNACRELTCRQPLRDERMCNEGCSAGGYPLSGTCRCPSNRRGTCCEEEIYCPAISKPAHTAVSTSGYTVGSVARFSCHDGFRQTAGDNNLPCKKVSDNGVWQGTYLQCDAITCPLPTVTEHVYIINSYINGYTFGERIVFSCEEGYELDGPESQECLERGLSDFTPHCTAVECLDPGLPLNGNREGMDLRFGHQVTFSCNAGYKMLGSEILECTSSKIWFGHIPTCEQITCEAPYVPSHGSVRVSKGRPTADFTGARAIFSCEEGYTLQGAMTLKCTSNGLWDVIEPECKAVDCMDPGDPENGYRDGSIFTFGWYVTFTCLPGYILQGRDKMQCLQTGTWSADVPTCLACPVNTYAGTNNDCLLCPANTHTGMTASKFAQDCICDEGFTLVAGGACEKIQCEELPLPEMSQELECGVLVGEECHFTCEDGFVVESGSTSRLCQENGVWSGSQLLCMPCKMHTYKSSDYSCTACPANSETTDSAQMLTGCLCKVGYEGPSGGPCLDANECAANDGMGPCEQKCANQEGTYKCRCPRIGYEVDPADSTKCYPEQECKNLTSIDAPTNGGVVCKWWADLSSQFCQTKCNFGHEHPLGVNTYETCGPNTNFKWSFRLELDDFTAPLPPCVLADFPDFRLEADMFYFTKDCDQLTEEDKQEVYNIFQGTLTEKGVCVDSRAGQSACNVDTSNMGIICGAKTRRRRRSANGTISYEVNQSISILLNITALKDFLNRTEITEEYCPMLHLPPVHCKKPEKRLQAMARYLRRAVQVSGLQLKRLVSQPDLLRGMKFQAASREFEAKKNGVTTKMHVGCEEGFEERGEDSCTPCQPGTYHEKDTGNCTACPVGTFQYKTKQTSCIRCPTGSTTPTTGSTTCYACADGFWGRNCEDSCACVHGTCDRHDGSCRCDSGWEGGTCDADVPGCRYTPCFQGVECHDIFAPNEGFRCGDCPPGFRGNGQMCIRVTSERRRRDLHLLLHHEL